MSQQTKIEKSRERYDEAMKKWSVANRNLELGLKICIPIIIICAAIMIGAPIIIWILEK